MLERGHGWTTFDFDLLAGKSNACGDPDSRLDRWLPALSSNCGILLISLHSCTQIPISAPSRLKLWPMLGRMRSRCLLGSAEVADGRKQIEKNRRHSSRLDQACCLVSKLFQHVKVKPKGSHCRNRHSD